MKTVQILLKQQWPSSILSMMASNRFTLILLMYLSLSIIVYYQLPVEGRFGILIAPVLLLLINFIAALMVRRVLIGNLALMLFHFALFMLVALVLLGQMSSLKGTLELATKEEFSGNLENVQQGAWHDYGLNNVRFINLGFDIYYHKGVKRDSTLNRIALFDENGQQQVIEIGDHVPLVIGHYRFYTTHNKGYAPVFEWTPADSNQPVTGSIHLPAYPVNEYKQALEWQIPGSRQKIWTMLQISDDLLPLDREFQFQLPQQHSLVIRVNEQRYEVNSGDEIALEQGILKYQGLTSWMGYKVDYDWSRPWLLATCLVAILSLFFHFIVKFRKDNIIKNEIN